ncbi:MAG: EAL domain-containing protein [Lachnospiraceae bacterium]|nr:EAL domain-containing protein [Lachnospiraceae bacterium]
MDRALVNREFQVYLQPKISTAKEVLGGAEALVRWIHPTEGFIPPNRFIPIFEKNGFILKLDDYLLEEIARVQAGWLAEGRKLVPISVNVSRAHFTREDLAEHICAIVDKYQVPHSVIELELTESAFFDDKKVLLNTVQKLRMAGFLVSMDDFGAGYSSLNSLKELQIDVLKIDADFFRGADVEERGLLIVSEVIDLAKKLNMKIVAEGIESREQVEFLTEQECDLIQGYFYAKPMPVAEFAQKYSV